MKKVLLLLTIIVITSASIVLFRPGEKPVTTENPDSATAPNATTAEIASRTSKDASVRNASESPLTGFLASDVMAAVRASIATKDRAGYDAAFKALVDYINAHPEEVDNYVSLLRTEQNEHVLRTFALALAETEVGLLANDQIIGAAIDLAKDSSFEQRQHIALNLMSKFPEMRDDVFETVLGLTQQDPNSQVKTSAVVVFADWMERLPENKEALLAHVGDIFNTAQDEDVRAFTYQLLALHKNDLPREMQLALSERLKTETDSYGGNLLALALSNAPDDIRNDAISHVQTAFGVEKDSEKQRNLLAQYVCLAKSDSIPLLQKTSAGNSLLAEDSKDYLVLLSRGILDPELVFRQKAIRDAQSQPHAHVHDDHKD